MAALAENIGLMFRIKADSTDAVRDLNKVQNEIKGVGTSAATAGGGMAALANPAALAATAIAAVGTAAIVAAKYLFDLTNAASEYGSKIKDATLKSGASVETIQALGFAAQQSGGSLEAIAGSVAKFSTLLGQAQLGNEKAQATLAQFGITAKDVDGALAQAIESISKMTDSTLQNAAAAALFKDRGGEVVKTIREMGGNLPDTIKKLQDLGIMLSKEDTEAADAFGDSLALLSTQIKTTGYKFAFEFMPQITSAIRQIIQWLSANSAEVRKWGQVFNETISGIKTYFGGLLTGINAAMNGINTAFGLSAQNAITWSTVMQGALGPIVALLRMISKPGDAFSGQIGTGVDSALSAVNAPGIRVPKMPTLLNAGGGGSGGGGGKDNAANDAEQRRRKAVQEAEQEMADTFAIYQAGYAKRLALLDYNLAQKLTSELAYIRDVGRVHLEALMDEKTLNEQLSKNENLNAEERKKILNKIKVLTIEIANEKIKTSAKVIDQINKENDAAEEAHQKELKRLQDISDKRQRAFADYQNKRQERLRQERLEQTIGGDQYVSVFDKLMQSAVSSQNTAAIAGIQALTGALGQLGQAIGQVVSAWVLYGSAGTSVRKVTAMILAGIAQQAAIQAVFQLAEGFAKLAMAFFGVPNAGPSATAHFIAAGMYAAIAGTAAIAGRAVAGNAFKDQTSNATGGSGSGSNANGSPSETRYTTEFGGYGNGRDNILVRTLDRVNTTLGLVEETQHQFNRKVLGMSPTDVVVLGANGASREIRGAVESELSSDVGTTDGFMRGLGFAR